MATITINEIQLSLIVHFPHSINFTGVPAAYRGLVWQKISLASIYRLRHPADYFATLLSRSEEELPKEVVDDIERDIDRYLR